LKDFQELQGIASEVNDKPLELEALLGLGAANYILSLENPDAGPKCRDFYEQAYALADQLGDKRGKVRALLPTRWLTDYWPEYAEQAKANTEEALALSLELGDEVMIMEAEMAAVKFADGADALAQAEEITRKLQATRDLLRLKEHYFAMMWLTRGEGQFERSVEICDMGIELASQLRMLPVQYPTIKSLALLDLGRLGEAYESAQQEVSDEEHPFGRANRELATCLYLEEIMAFDRAEESLGRVIQQILDVNRTWMLRLAIRSLAKVLIALDRWDESAQQRIEQHAGALGIGIAIDIRTEIALAEGRFDDAMTLAEQTSGMRLDHLGDDIQRTNEHNDRGSVIAVELNLRVLLALKRYQDVIVLADEAVETANEMGFQIMLWRILASRADAHEQLGDSDVAVADRQASAEVLKALAESITDLELRNGFVTNPQVASILTGPAARLPHLTSGDT
jgi:tetratricopeptide (TPR) repeat protein